MEIRDIKQFMDWCKEGPATYPQRKELFETQKVHMEEEITRMNRTLDMLKFKCWYYEQAIRDGNEERLKAMIPDRLPEEIRTAYENSPRKITAGLRRHVSQSAARQAYIIPAARSIRT